MKLTADGKVTLYLQGDLALGLRKVEATGLTVEIRPCAQYQAAVHASFLPKRARRLREISPQTSRPLLLVLGGWGHPDPDGLWDESTAMDSDSVTTVRGRYRSCDP